MKNYLDKFSLKGKTVYVVGGAGLIGTEVSKALASAGGGVIILDIDQKKGEAIAQEIKRGGCQAHYEYFNIGELETTDLAIEQLIKKYKAIDSWVNVSYPKTKDWPKALENMELAHLRKNIDIHLNSCIWTSRKISMVMKESKIKGSIINFGSIYGVQANDFTIYENTPMFGPVLYCAIKAGIINLTRYLASYFGPFGIRSNSICPGGIFDNQNETFVRNYNKKVPLKRMGTPEDVASVVLFLVSDASAYINGEAMMVDGGWTIV